MPKSNRYYLLITLQLLRIYRNCNHNQFVVHISLNLQNNVCQKRIIWIYKCPTYVAKEPNESTLCKDGN